uniref:Uncharacterized protein n=1 Tax=Borrelia hermsii TaxID=140 RepID=T1ECA3_BORHE|nr:hypothetical protein BHA067 [Borrelia hermsii]
MQEAGGFNNTRDLTSMFCVSLVVLVICVFIISVKKLLKNRDQNRKAVVDVKFSL